MLDGELLQDGGGSPRRGSDNGQQGSWSPKQDAQWREQPYARLLDVKEVGAEEDHRHADALAQTRGFAECWPGEKQRESRIEGEQGTDQRCISTRKRESRKQRGCPVEERGSHQRCGKDAIGVGEARRTGERDAPMPRSDRALGEQQGSGKQDGQRSRVDDPGHQRWTSVAQETLVQDGQKGGQNSSGERQQSGHAVSLSRSKSGTAIFTFLSLSYKARFAHRRVAPCHFLSALLVERSEPEMPLMRAYEAALDRKTP